MATRTARKSTAAAHDAAQARPRKRLSREELAPIARESLFDAATRVVGEVGYAEASVARITEAAGMAQGTFYLYFSTRQSLFDELLPHARQEMLDLVRERTRGVADFFEMEERGMAAFLEYLQRNPGFLRVLNEAEAVAPRAYKAHYEDIAERYGRVLRRARDEGQVRWLENSEVQSATWLMMGARVSMYQMCLASGLRMQDATARAVKHYMGMVRAWLGKRA
jgi:AcrR family transcriptional regulator